MRLDPLSTEFHPVASHLLPVPFNPMAVYPEEITAVWVQPWESESVGGSYLRGIPQWRLFGKI